MPIWPNHVMRVLGPVEGAPAGRGGTWAAEAASRHCPSPLGVLLLPLVAALSAALLWLGVADGPVYTVPTLNAHLARDPDVWLGRTVRVRGTVLLSGCVSLDAGSGTPCRDRSVYLLDRDGASLLPVAWGQPDPLLAPLRRLPLAGRLVPGAQVVRWGALATYRVRLLVAPATACSATPCYEALLLDAALGSPAGHRG